MPSHPIIVEIEPRYLPEQSSPEEDIYTFSYAVTVTNNSKIATQLIARHWYFSDSSGNVQEVKGLGVIGQQPLLAPGASFQYSSGCRLKTPSGSMHGSFFMVTEHGDRFDAPIAMVMLEADLGGAPAPRVLH
ncbi:Co2+/Mg2+ efflux protein ApaG [Variovorax humicola]|uniref:Protein ApaG n=1 Tax=Variovorax humicola TaxID=1769758 RepID=A0ABU8W6D1_9BURK